MATCLCPVLLLLTSCVSNVRATWDGGEVVFHHGVVSYADETGGRAWLADAVGFGCDIVLGCPDDPQICADWYDEVLAEGPLAILGLEWSADPDASAEASFAWIVGLAGENQAFAFTEGLAEIDGRGPNLGVYTGDGDFLLNDLL